EPLGASVLSLDQSNPGEFDANLWDEAAHVPCRTRERERISVCRARTAAGGANRRMPGQRFAAGYRFFGRAVSERFGRARVRGRRERRNRISLGERAQRT